MTVCGHGQRSRMPDEPGSTHPRRWRCVECGAVLAEREPDADDALARFAAYLESRWPRTVATQVVAVHLDEWEIRVCVPQNATNAERARLVADEINRRARAGFTASAVGDVVSVGYQVPRLGIVTTPMDTIIADDPT